MPIQHIEALRGESKKGKDEIQLAEGGEVAAWGLDAELTIVGHAHPRLEGADKVTGRARYASDMHLSDQLYGRILRSPYPHARIRHIDTSAAATLPGVHAVLSSADELDVTFYEEESPLFANTLRFQGDEVAAVAAESEEIAEDALRLIKVDYEVLPFVSNLAAAMQPNAAAVHTESNILEPKTYERGDWEAGLQAADVVIDQIYTTQTAVHNSLESHGCTARWEGEQLTLWESTQGIFEVREQVAEKLKLPEHRVRIIKQHMGGGFGAKQVVWKPSVIAALLAKKAGRPVQLMLERQGENLAAGNRNATQQSVRIGAKRDGTLTAITADIYMSIGAYQVGGEGSNVAGVYERLYRCLNVHTQQAQVYTNIGPSVAFRAPGYVEGAFALESAIDELARALQIDPLELRLRNYSERDQKKDQPYTLPEGLRLCYQRATEAFGWPNQQQSVDTQIMTGNKRRGIGIAAHEWGGGSGHPPGYAWVKFNGDGSVDVITGAQDIGTGSRTGLAQVAAEELGIPLSQINLHLGDTATGPYAPTSAGSATQATLGPAIRVAAANARQQLLEVASLILEEEPERLRIRDGKVFVEGQPENSVTVAEVTGRVAPQMIQGQGARGPNPEGKTIRTFGVQCAEVEVDVETGEVTLLRLVAAHDCGRIINPTLVDSQVIGGITQGIGFALTESQVIDEASGTVLNPNLEEYKIPTIADVPLILHARVGQPDVEANSTGAKGIGEPPLVPTAPAIANAIFDAVGLRLRNAPLTRQRLVEHLATPPMASQPSGEKR
ncbi:MAG: xanthine dehydrogenase family protein molybdopterin-binding subunit [Caldilineaceae bacterium]